jgi:hypothetical protein
MDMQGGSGTWRPGITLSLFTALLWGLLPIALIGNYVPYLIAPVAGFKGDVPL